MAKFKYSAWDKASGWISDNLGWAGEFFENLAKWFGIDAKKYFTKWTGTETDITDLTRLINEAFSKAEIKTAQDADKIQKAAESLIGITKSPVIKKHVAKLNEKLQQQYQNNIKRAAELDLNKTKLQNLASDIDSSTFIGLGSSETQRKYKELQHGIRQVSNGKVQLGNDSDQPVLDNVEERLQENKNGL